MVNGQSSMVNDCMVDISGESHATRILSLQSCKYNNLRASPTPCSTLPFRLSLAERDWGGRTAGDGKLRAISKARLWRHRLYTCLLSTSSSRTTLIRRSNLVAGFVLRCFQRLSDPDVDTRRCSWRNNRQTRGLSNTVLSY